MIKHYHIIRRYSIFFQCDLPFGVNNYA